MQFLSGQEVKDLYDSERKALRDIAFTMRVKHSFKGVSTVDEEQRIKVSFTREMKNRCAEIGLIADVEWEWEDVDKRTGEVKDFSPNVSDNPTDHNLYWNPRVVIVGRTDKIEEYDHDQQQHEVRHGLLDGIEGTIDPNTGLLGEGKKKDIF